MKLIFACLIVLCLLSLVIEAQRRSRFRNRGRRPKGNCHLKEIDQCFSKLDKYSKSDNTSYLLTTARGVDEICTNALDVVTCFKAYMKRCGTPLQRELFDFSIEYFFNSVDEFCKPGVDRENFLKYSPCINEKVLIKKAYKEKCSNSFLATIDKTHELKELDDRLDTVCCSFNRWQSCLFSMINKECGTEARQAMHNFMDKAFGGLTGTVCNKNEFPFNSNKCKKFYAEPGTVPKGKLSDHPVTKYLATYFAFLF